MYVKDMTLDEARYQEHVVEDRIAARRKQGWSTEQQENDLEDIRERIAELTGE